MGNQGKSMKILTPKIRTVNEFSYYKNGAILLWQKEKKSAFRIIFNCPEGALNLQIYFHL